ncbi:alkyl sulfatase dimerization domain-containing protein [Streptomyces venezuelae]|uniref:alkyl sulfatase dimerization domain-containing protein n=1 Tax=Streptomyces venezuelae TaxID=54571 RepID=UPI001686C8AC|nr:alkyl sulfatase dimerization domain-containing protein [Streptomyces venezuelae]
MRTGATRAAKRYVDLAGGPDQALAKARGYVERGDLRFAATLLHHLVFADPATPRPRRPSRRSATGSARSRLPDRHPLNIAPPRRPGSAPQAAGASRRPVLVARTAATAELPASAANSPL